MNDLQRELQDIVKYEETKEYKKRNIFSLTILPTEFCNFACAYCYEKLHGAKWKLDNDEILLEFVDLLFEKYDGITVGWFGGEPLIEIDVVKRISKEIVKRASATGKSCSISITTNGFFLNKKNFKELILAGVSSFQITLDGIRDEHDQIRTTKTKIKTYDVIMNNLLDIKSSKFPFFEMCIRLNITKENLKSLKEHCNQLEAKFNGDDRFQFFFRPVGDWGGDRVKEISEDLVTDENIFREIVKMNINLNMFPHYAMMKNSDCYAKKDGSIVLGPDLRMMKCTVILDDDTNILGTLTKGNTKYSFPYPGVDKSLGDYNSKCESCEKISICSGYSCPLQKIKNPDAPQCGYELKYMEDIYKMMSNQETVNFMKKVIGEKNEE